MLSVVNLLANKLFIVGADECGWGAVAGPLVVCGVKAPKDWSIPGLNDSKKFKVAENREAMCYKLFKLIDNGIITCHIAERTNDIIDKNGPYPTLKDCYVEIFHTLYCKDSLIIADGNMKFDGLGVDHYDKVSEPKADGKYPAVMAASIIGKTYRDHLMTILHDKYPIYDWKTNKGYPRPEHLALIKQIGPCLLHRFSYAPMKNMNLELFKDKQ